MKKARHPERGVAESKDPLPIALYNDCAPKEILRLGYASLRMTLSFILLFFYSAYASLQAQELTLLFAGDAMQHQSQIDNAFRNGNYDYSSYFSYIEHEVSQADLAFVNLEVTLGGKPYRGYPSFSAPDEYAIALEDAGFDVFLTANNHILDKGSKGFLRTLDVLDSMRIKHTGVFRNEAERNEKYPLFIEKNGIRIAVLNYTYGTNGLSVKPPLHVNYIEKEIIREDMEKARVYRPDLIIACMHWGVEYKLLPNKKQEDLAAFLREEGVDLIIGSHPHVVQPSRLEIAGQARNDKAVRNDNLVAFSLGNLISGMKAPNTEGGQLLKVVLKKEDDRIEIQWAGYILVYRHIQTNENKSDFQVIPVCLAEMPEKMLPKAYRTHLDEDAWKKLSNFAKNAREILDTHNQNVPEIPISINYSKTQ